MTYPKQVREYCLNNQGTVLDVSLMKDSEFSEIPYKTLLKILNRLEEEKLISGISKGVYAIGKLNVQNEPDIMREYTENGKGMIVGSILYQGLGLSSYHPLVTEIYTNAMSSAHKNIGRFRLTRVKEPLNKSNARTGADLFPPYYTNTPCLTAVRRRRIYAI